ncbi:MAG: hypothetical protein KY475_14155, partial [Planctomycetes bacterium]|nr:hypothetical protein [Planctomycetota bacterium]
MPPQRVLLIGDCDHPDFAGLAPWLHERCEVASASDIAEAAPFATAPDLCIFVEARPGLIRQEDVEAVHRAAPLARLAVIAGAWCEGEMRTGAPPAGVVRMYWHEWPARLRSLWDSASETEANAWRLPRTALSGERTLASGVRVEEERRLIAVRAESAVSFGSLAAVLQAAGHAAVWITPSQPSRVRGAAALLWEGDVRHASQADELAHL